jgi:outer membrane cobalamin receptor
LGLRDDQLQIVGGVEYQVDAFSERLSNILFAKGYAMHTQHQARVTQTDPPEVLEVSRDMNHWGFGDALRYRFASWVWGKASYEYATRLPMVDELFGDGVLVESNVDLKPEVSHNLNLGPRMELQDTPLGEFVLDVNAFLRESKEQIILLAGKQFIPYANIADMRSLGVESALNWSAPGRWMSLEGTWTWQDLRNTSKDGPFAGFEGMRIPSRPYSFASWGARFRWANYPFSLEPFYYGRYVHGFDRGWEIGEDEFKISLPPQISHDVGVTYTVGGPLWRFNTTFQVDNVGDAALYDVFGVQRPGRSFSLKLTAQL